ncbi:MAG: hypothetical protein JW860_16450 [Sedimentisphaerales bacterium]|nr:hypothetical protein [Sedimentisphaerales bacterium]
MNEVIISANPAGLNPGEYEGEITITDPSASNSPQTVNVRLQVFPEGQLLTMPAEYPSIQAAINAAVNGQTIMLADGFYTGSGNRNIDFHGKAITLRSENGPDHCIISCQGNDYHYHYGFIFQNGEGPNSILDGITIMNGYRYDSDGAGIQCYHSSPHVKNCVFLNNHGGGICNSENSNPTLIQCAFLYNNSNYGGGMYNILSNPQVIDCVFHGNFAYVGGGMRGGPDWVNLPEVQFQVTRCMFTHNSAQTFKGAIDQLVTGNIIFSDCSFIRNNCIGETENQAFGGAVSFLGYQGEAVVDNCIFHDNSATTGGAIYLVEYLDSQATFINCSFTENQAGIEGGGIVNGRQYMNNAFDLHLIDCAFRNNINGALETYGGNLNMAYCSLLENQGTAFINNLSSSILNDCDFINNSYFDGPGGLTNHDGDMTLNNCNFYYNSGRRGGMLNTGGIAILNNCIFKENVGDWGGGYANSSGGQSTLLNCLFVNNSATVGGAFRNIESDATLTNCTLFGNTAENVGGIYNYTSYSSITLTNSILWNNSDDTNGTGKDAQINSQGTQDINYSCIMNLPEPLPGKGNINLDPLFVDTPGGDFHLQPYSPCIDAGDPASDFGLEPEPDGGRVNMGAYGNTPQTTSKGGLILRSCRILDKIRVGRTLFEYQIAVTLNNNGLDPLTNIQLEILNASGNVVITDSLVTFDSLEPAQTLTSADTFTLRVDR